MKWIFTKIRSFIAGEKVKLAGATPGQKWEYFWDYYKWPAIVIILLIASVIYTAFSIRGQKEPAITGYFLDSFQEVFGDEKERVLFPDFYERAGIDADTNPFLLHVNMTVSEGPVGYSSDVVKKLMLDIALGEVDFVTAFQQVLTDFSYNSTPYFQDLREFLTEEQLKQYAGRIFYVDEAKRPTSSQVLYNNQEISLLLPSDPLNPSSMTDPIPIAIDVRSNSEIDALYPLNKDPVYLAFFINAPHAELLPLLLEYLLS